MCSCVYLYQNDHSLNSLSPLCNLLEKIGVKILPSDFCGVNYRNNDAALILLQHTAIVLHDSLVRKLKKSPVLGKYLWLYVPLSVAERCFHLPRLVDG